MSFDDIMSGIRRLRTSIRTSTGRPDVMPRDKIRLLGQTFTAKLQGGVQAQQCNTEAGCPPNNPTPNKGLLRPQSTSQPRTRLLNFGLLQQPPPPQPEQIPPTEEQKREMAQQQKAKELEAKLQAGREKKYRRDTAQGLSVA